MGCSGSKQGKSAGDPGAPQPPPREELPPAKYEEAQKLKERREWGIEMGEELQEAMDSIFQQEAEDLLELQFSFTIADPHIPECPLIGCSTGFSTLCGYELSEIVGRNCRFLVDPVPKEFINMSVRKRARDFCVAAQNGEMFKLDDNDKDEWMPKHKEDELYCVQMNARKDGSLFRNMFYMRTVKLNEKTYVVALQTEMTDAVQAALEKAAKTITSNMDKLEDLLAKQFWYSGPMRRQDKPEEDGYTKMSQLVPL